MFDAERYLRRLGEHAVLGIDDDQHGFGSPLSDAATALVAVGAIAPDHPREVLSDYAAARAARDASGHFLMARLTAGWTPPALQRPAVGRMVALHEELEVAGWSVRLRYIELGAERTEISATYSARDPTPHRRMVPGHLGIPAALSKPTVTDDQGTALALHMGGGGSDDRWDAELTVDRPLATDTRRIELFGRRIELVDTPIDVEVTTESVDPDDPAHRHLWRRIAIGNRHFGANELGPATEALIAAGALAADDPMIELARLVQERVPGGMRHHPGSGSGAVHNAPDPWPSLLRRAGRSDGPTGMVIVGVATPVFDDHAAAVYCLDSHADGFTMLAAVSPPDVERHPGNLDLEDRSLAWWARDDRGNHYLGTWNGSRGDDAIKTGTLAFAPALDPVAKRLEVLPTGLHARAVISFPLTWSER